MCVTLPTETQREREQKNLKLFFSKKRDWEIYAMWAALHRPPLKTLLFFFSSHLISSSPERVEEQHQPIVGNIYKSSEKQAAAQAARGEGSKNVIESVKRVDVEWIQKLFLNL